MKIKNFIFFGLLSVILSGLFVFISISITNYKEISIQINQNQIYLPNSYQAASISKRTILLLLAAGIIGVLGISRRKKNIGGPAQRNEASSGSEHQNSNKDEQEIIF